MAKSSQSYVIEPIGRFAYQARVGSRVVGQATAWTDSRGVFSILSVTVREKYRRRGIARALYAAIESEAATTLRPAVSVSDDAFEFWKKFRPEAVAADLRHRRAELMGRALVVKCRRATVVSVGSGGMTAKYDDATERVNSETFVRTRDVELVLI